jgi:plastocyanin
MSTDETNAAVSRRGFLKAGAGATAAAATAGTAAGQEDGNESEGDGGGGGGGSETVAVIDNEFDPAELYVAPGTTVTWEWEGDGHNVVVDSQPDEANWEGHEPIENSGFTHEHTFETLGEYAYYCAPHQSLGMEGTVIVNEEGQEPGGGGGGGPSLPDSALTMGVATMAAMVSTLALAFFFIKYGGDYETPE